MQLGHQVLCRNDCPPKPGSTVIIKDEVAQRQEGQHGLCRGVRLDGNGGADAVFPDAAQGLERVFLRVGLNMER